MPTTSGCSRCGCELAMCAGIWLWHLMICVVLDASALYICLVQIVAHYMIPQGPQSERRVLQYTQPLVHTTIQRCHEYPVSCD